MAARDVQLRLGLDTKKASKSAASFWSKFAQLSRASAAQAASGSSQLGARQIGGGIGATVAGTFASGVVGEASSALFSFAGRAGNLAFRDQIKFAQNYSRDQKVIDQLRPIAEAQALATGNIDRESILRLAPIFNELERRRETGRAELSDLLTMKRVDPLLDTTNEILIELRKLNPLIKAGFGAFGAAL